MGKRTREKGAHPPRDAVEQDPDVRGVHGALAGRSTVRDTNDDLVHCVARAEGDRVFGRLMCGRTYSEDLDWPADYRNISLVTPTNDAPTCVFCVTRTSQ